MIVVGIILVLLLIVLVVIIGVRSGTIVLLIVTGVRSGAIVLVVVGGGTLFGHAAGLVRPVADVQRGVVVCATGTVERYGDSVVALVELGAVVRVGLLEESAVVAFDVGRAGDLSLIHI